MIDLRADSIIYQSQGYLVTLVTGLIADKKLGKALNSQWDKADLIISYLEAWEEKDKLDDPSDINFVLECLISLCKLNQFPAAPTITGTTPPAIIIGEKGEQGDKGNKGDKGDTGLATDFQVALISVPTIVDQFPITDAKGARWDYVATKSTGEQRSGSVIGTWTPTGTAVEFNDTSTDDLIGTTENLEFLVQFSGSNIQLIAVPTAGQWEIVGSRYFIPNNGNGSGPISGALAAGNVYIGNLANLAQARVIGGAFTIDYLGVATLAADIITNANINNAAAIAFSKMAALSANELVITDGSGVITTSASPTLTEVGYLAGVTSSLQAQIDGKLSDPMSNIGDIIIRNGSNITVALGVGSPGQVLTVSGAIPSWQTPASGFADPLTSVGDLMHRNSGNVTARLGIGSSGQVLTVVGSLPVWQNPSAGFADPMTTIGDMMIRDGSNNTSRIGIGTTGQVLTVLGGVPIWSDNRLAANGLTLSGNTIRLGGTLDANTVIATNGFYLQITKPDQAVYGALEFVIGVSDGFRSTTFQPGSGSLLSSFRTFGGGTSIATVSSAGSYIFNFNDQVILTDARGTPRGIEYGGTGYVTQLHSLTDKEYVDNAITSAAYVPVVGGYLLGPAETQTTEVSLSPSNTWTYGPYRYSPSIGEGIKKIIDWNGLIRMEAGGNDLTVALDRWQPSVGSWVNIFTQNRKYKSGGGNPAVFIPVIVSFIDIPSVDTSYQYRVTITGPGLVRVGSSGNWRIFSAY